MMKKINISNLQTLDTKHHLFNNYEHLLNTGFCYIDYSENQVYISNTVYILLNISEYQNTLTSNDILHFIKKEERNKFLNQFFSKIPFKKELKGQYTIITDPDNERIVQLLSRTYFDTHHKPLYTISTITDITLEENKLQEINLTNMQLQAIFEQTLSGIILLDIETMEFQAVNPAICSMLGYSQNELITMSVLDIHPKEFHSFIRSQFDLQSSGKLKTALNIPMQRKDGSIFYADITRKVITIQGKRFISSFFTDLSEQKEMQERLLASDNRFKQLVAGLSTIAVQGYDQNHRVIYWNKASEKLYGYSSDEAMGHLLEDLIIPEEAVDDVRKGIDNWIENDIVIPSSELVLKHKDGSDVKVFSSHVMQTNIEGKKELFCVDIDLSELSDTKELNTQLTSSLNMQNIVLSLSTDFMFLLDMQGRILWWNKALETVTKRSHKEIDRLFAIDFVAKRYQKKVRELIKVVLKKGIVKTDFPILTSKGERIYHFNAQMTVVDGVNCIAGTGHDIHDLIEQKRIINEQNKFFKDLNSITDILASNKEIDSKINDILLKILTIFNVEIAWFYHKQNKKDGFVIEYEASKKGYGSKNIGQYILREGSFEKEILAKVKKHKAPLQVERSSFKKHVPKWVDRMQIKSSTLTIINPYEDDLWILGMHQCKEVTRYSDTQLHLFDLIARRIEAIFGQLLLTKQLQRDIQKRKKIEHELRQSQYDLKLAATVFRNTDEGVIITDKDAVIQDVNDAFTSITGYTKEEVIGKKPNLLMSSKHTKNFWNEFWYQLRTRGSFSGEVINCKKDGSLYPEWLTVSDVLDKNDRLTGYVGVFSDISELKTIQEKLDHHAHHDILTDLPNRLLFNNQLTHAIKRATRNRTRFALIFLDLDHFKDINDSLGHTVGDELLKEVALRLSSVIRMDDTLSRFGGDEFVILLENIQKNNDIVFLVDKIKSTFKNAFNLQDKKFYISSSMGIAIYPDDGEEGHELIKNADTAMYSAKDDGRNRYRFYTQALTEEAINRMEIENAMREAIDHDYFQLYYQPQIDVLENNIIGFEALIRWEDPIRGFVSPNHFIPLAEDSGLIVDIGRWVMKEVCRQAALWKKEKLDCKKISINISGQQVWNTSLYKELKEQIESNGLKSSCIEIEITESFLMREVKKGVKELQALRDYGVTIAVDDFGTGYSSLNYLKQLPITKLKIDKSFIDHVPYKEDDVAITKTIISLAENLGLEIIAEGVETKAQLEFLLQEGCTQIQGYYYSKPLNVTEATEYLKRFKDKKVSPRFPSVFSYQI